jgi:hypothetical protein
MRFKLLVKEFRMVFYFIINRYFYHLRAWSPSRVFPFNSHALRGASLQTLSEELNLKILQLGAMWFILPVLKSPVRILFRKGVA